MERRTLWICKWLYIICGVDNLGYVNRDKQTLFLIHTFATLNFHSSTPFSPKHITWKLTNPPIGIRAHSPNVHLNPFELTNGPFPVAPGTCLQIHCELNVPIVPCPESARRGTEGGTEANQMREGNEVAVGKKVVNEDIVIVRVTDTETATGIADETGIVIEDIVAVDTMIRTATVIETETVTETTRIMIAGGNEVMTMTVQSVTTKTELRGSAQTHLTPSLHLHQVCHPHLLVIAHVQFVHLTDEKVTGLFLIQEMSSMTLGAKGRRKVDVLLTTMIT